MSHLMSKYSNMGENVGGYMNERREEVVLTSLEPCDHVYASAHSNAKKGACDVIRNVKYLQAFQSLNIPSSSTLNIPNTDIVENILINVKMTVQNTRTLGSSPTDLFYVPAGVAWELVDYIQYTINGSQTYTVSGPQLLEFQMLSIETAQKRQAILDLAGPAQAMAINGTTALSCDLILNVPALCKLPSFLGSSLPLDCRMFNNISQVIVYWKNLPNKSYVVGANTFTFSVVNNAFTEGRFIVINDTFVDPNLSLATVLKSDPMATYVHPHTFLQSFTISLAGESVGTVHNKTISGFRFGSLTGILLKVYDPNLWNATNPLSSCEITDLQVLYNGVTLYNLPSRTNLLAQAVQGLDLPVVAQSLENGKSINNYLYEAQFSIEDSARESADVMNGIQIGNNSLIVQFKSDVSKMSNAGVANATFSSDAVLQICYLYNCGLVVSQGGARCDFIF